MLDILDSIVERFAVLTHEGIDLVDRRFRLAHDVAGGFHEICQPRLVRQDLRRRTGIRWVTSSFSWVVLPPESSM